MLVNGDNQRMVLLKTHLTGLGCFDLVLLIGQLCVCVRHPDILTIWPESVEFSKPTIFSAQALSVGKSWGEKILDSLEQIYPLGTARHAHQFNLF